MVKVKRSLTLGNPLYTSDPLSGILVAVRLETPRTISISGAITWSTTFDGSGNVTGVATLANSGVSAGTYDKVTVNEKGIVTAGEVLPTPAYTIRDLTDVPDSFTGHENHILRIKADGTGVEFVSQTVATGTVTQFTDLLDVPTTYSGNELKQVRVNSAGTALEFYTPVTGTNSLTFTNAVNQSIIDLRPLNNLAYKVSLSFTSASAVVTYTSVNGTITENINTNINKIYNESELIHNITVSGTCNVLITINYKN